MVEQRPGLRSHHVRKHGGPPPIKLFQQDVGERKTARLKGDSNKNDGAGGLPAAAPNLVSVSPSLLIHLLVSVAGVSIVMERERQQNDSLANG